MNTPESYERRSEPTAAVPAPPVGVQGVDALAVHQDPSLPAGQAASPQAGRLPRASIDWVRPTDLLMSVGAARLGQVADAQAAVLRRSRRAPLMAVSRLRGRTSRSSIARPGPAGPTPTSLTNGVEL